ncbi:COX15/CtaA family protein [Allonocardiopsis opalescens]|uniref:Cytochrome c oxidase assembly protein subunit 15 n=1 Tax=Allonocardiopsis opalescens TaxID=1144618 RepID=A0A2T0PUE6_9ACTN|nr:COX15/CtaA family protein [Allonocardiopsis opalescens]PRX92532.1 cytochrome c oxidase assembly protein subunit 15 [Allonocardiopsis opalescens]
MSSASPRTPSAAPAPPEPPPGFTERLPRPVRAVLDSFLRPTTGSLRGWALAGIAVNMLIAVTGATVRVTESGLGCPEWPLCTADSLVPTGEALGTVHAFIEFGNRTLTSVVLAVALIVTIATWRRFPGRPRLLAVALVQPAGCLGQAVVGGITVWSDLHPAAVGAHFLVSMAMLVAAVALYVRVREGTAPAVPRVHPAARYLGYALLLAGAAVLVAGVVTTGTGPHGGDAASPRWPLDLHEVARVHSVLAWVTTLFAVALLVVLYRTGAPADTRRYGWVLIAAVAAQGVIGYVQYALALPEALVVAHVLGAIVLWVALLRLFFSLTERPEAPAGAVPATAEV